jgi:hypothetical protein
MDTAEFLRSLPRLCGAENSVCVADSLREQLVQAALERNVDENALRDKLTEALFHARPWIDGTAKRILDGLASGPARD